MSTFPILHAGDLQRSLRFYRDELGFTLEYRWPAEGDPDYLYLEREGSGLGIGRPDKSAHGLPVRAARADKPRGERIAFVGDPDGYPILLIQKAAAAESKS